MFRWCGQVDRTRQASLFLSTILHRLLRLRPRRRSRRTSLPERLGSAADIHFVGLKEPVTSPRYPLAINDALLGLRLGHSLGFGNVSVFTVLLRLPAYVGRISVLPCELFFFSPPGCRLACVREIPEPALAWAQVFFSWRRPSPACDYDWLPLLLRQRAESPLSPSCSPTCVRVFCCPSLCVCGQTPPSPVRLSSSPSSSACANQPPSACFPLSHQATFPVSPIAEGGSSSILQLSFTRSCKGCCVRRIPLSRAKALHFLLRGNMMAMANPPELRCHVQMKSSDGALCALVSDLESSSQELQCRAAMEIRLLAKQSTENRLRIASIGAVIPLVALLTHPDPQIQEYAVTAVFNLSLCDENKVPIAAAGAINHLVQALGTGTPIARENAACALFHLALMDDLCAAIGNSGAISPLIALLQTGGSRGKKDAVTALFALMAIKDNATLAVEAGVVRLLLDLMSDPESDMVDKAAYVLQRVLEAPKGWVTVVDEGGVPVLVEVLEMGSKRQQVLAMLSLIEICKKNTAYRRMVVSEGGIPPLIALSHSSPSNKVREKAQALVELLRQPAAATCRCAPQDGAA